MAGPEVLLAVEEQAASDQSELAQAAIFTLYSMPNPAKPSQPVLSVDPLGVVAVKVNEQLHRFPIDLAAGTRVGEPAATVAMQWTPCPEDFVPVPGVAPPPTVLDPTRSQPFITLNGLMTYLDGQGTAIQAFGHGRTFPMSPGPRVQLELGAVVNGLNLEGRFHGLSGTTVVNGHIQPPSDLSLCIVARLMDPRGTLQTTTTNPPQLAPNPDPDYATLILEAELDPAAPGDAQVDGDGNITGWNLREQLRLINIDWDTGAGKGVRSEHSPGVVVGTYTTRVYFAPNQPRSPAYPAVAISSRTGVMEFVDTLQNPIGRIVVDMFDGDAFPASNAGPANVYRFGAFGPVNLGAAQGVFTGCEGMLTANGSFSITPHATSTLYILRLYDPEGVLRTSLYDAWRLVRKSWPAAVLSTAEDTLLAGVEDALRQGLDLKSWWTRKDASGAFDERFELVRTFNPAERAYGFLDNAQLTSGPMPILGLYQQIGFDRPKVPVGKALQTQLREYVLHYFMRTTAFQQPAAKAGSDFGTVPPLLTGLIWKDSTDPSLRGFGYRQLYYKTIGGVIGRFDPEDEYKIIDLRHLGELFQWIVVKVNLFNFKVPFKPFGDAGPQALIPLQEESYLVLSQDFIEDGDGTYGLGYALLKGGPGNGVLSWGPGKFDAGFQTIHFEIDDASAVRVKMAFAVNQPEKIMNLPLDPIPLLTGAADALTAGMVSRTLAPLNTLLPRFISTRGFDPMQAWIAFMNSVTGGAAAENLGISRANLYRLFLVQHFMQHYEMITGALSTYRQIPDWLAESSLPQWIRTGVLDAVDY